jgi:hypothetical protein
MQFALISCRRATIETGDPGFIVSSTTRRDPCGADVILTKNGPTGTARLSFTKPTMTFQNLRGYGQADEYHVDRMVEDPPF